MESHGFGPRARILTHQLLELSSLVHRFPFGRQTTMQSERYIRQSFLGSDAEDKIANCRVAVIGLGGGGSHVVQQLAHIGFKRYVLYDGDIVEESNLNRLVGAKLTDVKAETPKLHIAKI